MKMIEAIERSAKFFRSRPQDENVRAATPGSSATARRSGIELRNVDLFRFVAFLLLLPNAIFAFSFRAAPGLVVLAACMTGAATLWRNPIAKDGLLAARVDPRTLLACGGASLALCLLGGEGHYFYAPLDWLWRDAVLADIVKNGVSTLYEQNGQVYLLRAPLGMYLTPGAVGLFFGLHAAHMALLAQNALILSAVLYFAALLAQVKRTPFIALLVVFSGADIVAALVAEIHAFLTTGSFLEFVDLEWWTAYWSKSPLQFSSHVTQWFWAPNHMIPGWWLALLALLHVRREVDLATFGVSFAALAFWSPLSIMGIAPFIAMFALEVTPRGLASPRLAGAAVSALGFTPILLYLSLDASAVPHEVLLGKPGFIFLYVVFLIVELPHVGVVAYAWPQTPRAERRLLLLAIAILCVVPFVRIGELNDFVMRASIPALFLLGFAFSRIAVLTPRDNGPFATVIGVVVIVTFAIPMMAFQQSLHGAYAISDCSFITAAAKLSPRQTPMNYLARIETVPASLAAPEGTPIKVENRQCWPDHPLLEPQRR